MDRGLARERTELAWLRTAISLAALGAAVAKMSLVSGLCVLGLAAGVWVFGLVVWSPARFPGDRRRMQAMTAVNVIVVLAALVMAVRGGGGLSLWWQ